MTDEQAKDDFLQGVRSQLSNNNDPPTSVSKYLLLDDVLYYVSEDEVFGWGLLTALYTVQNLWYSSEIISWPAWAYGDRKMLFLYETKIFLEKYV